MKKVMLSVFVTLFLVSATFSQEAAPAGGFDEPEWRFGLKIQPSLSWLGTTMKDFENGSSKLNFGYGGVVEKRLFKSAVLATGFLVNDFGGNYNYVGTEDQVIFKALGDSIYFESRKLKLKYVEIPLALKFRTPEINYFTYNAHFGIDMGFRVKSLADDNFRFGQNKSGLSEDEVINNDVNFMKLGLNVGLGAEYSIAGATSIMVGLSYVNGFTNVMRKESESLLYKTTGNRVTQIFYGHAVNLSVGVIF